ncbi:putative Ig domain-containing protein [Methylomonas sp. AM2-LC]|uniref:putative Ig domain-containing protein n=1 Tax=Methylomonas sp. AM2-LC TaxID=3153301 RepID=UPI003266A984
MKKLLLIPALMMLPLSTNAATYGPVANFDVINDTGKVAHGFEIELDGIVPSDITSLFGDATRWTGMERYGIPVVTTTATGVRVTYRDDTKSTPSGTLVVSPHDSCWPLGAPGPNGYGPQYPCDHFGVSTNKPTPVVRYNWLTETTPWPAGATTGPISRTDAFVPNVQINIAQVPPAVVVQPPAPAPGLPLPPPVNQPPAAAIHAVMAAPAPNQFEFGEPRWVKVTATGSLNNIAVEDLMGNNALMQKAQTQIEWQRLQYDAGATGGGANGTIDLSGVALDPGAIAVAYRFEYYAYNGDFDPQTHEAIGILDANGAVIPGSNVDTSGSSTPPVTVGRYLGAQMAGVNFDGNIPPAPPLPIAPTINAVIAGGVVGQAYSSTFDVTPILANDVLVVTITGLPAGLTYATVGSKVTISGAPSVVGSFPITIQADDKSNGTTISATTAIDIADAPMVFNVTFAPATVGTPYVYPFSVLGGYGTKTYSTVSPLPANLAIVNDTLAGTPSIDGTFAIIMTVKDSLGFTQNAASSNLVISKAPVVVVPPVPVPVACSGNNKVMTSASATVADIAGGIANNGQTVDLPAGVTFNAPLTAANAFVANNLLTYSGTVDNATNHCVASIAAIAQGLNVTYPVPYSGQVGVDYSIVPAGSVAAQIGISGGIGPYTVVANPLPLGMSLDATNTLIGTPTVAGTYNVSISVNDNNGQTSNSALTLVIAPAPVAASCAGTDEAITSIVSAARNTNIALFNGIIIKAPYISTAANNVAIPATGVTYTFLQGLANGSFPVGALITYSGSYGAASGGPNGNPMWCVPTTVTVKPKPAVCTAPQVLDVPTNTCVTPLSIAVPTLPSATVGKLYSTTFAGPTGGLAPYTVTVGAPAGLSGSLSGSTVTLAGTPTANGTFSVSLSVVDANGKTFSTTAPLTIASAPVLTCTKPAGATTYNGIQGNATAVSGTSVTIKGVVVNVPACTAISWQGNWTGLTKAIRVGYNVQVQKGYVLNGVITATSLTVDNGL